MVRHVCHVRSVSKYIIVHVIIMTEKKAQSKNKKSIDYSLCVICQKNSDEILVKNPVSHEKLLTFIKERVEYGD